MILQIIDDALNNPIESTMLLRLGINRIRLQRVKKTEESAKHKREIADLLAEGKDELARVRVAFRPYHISFNFEHSFVGDKRYL